MHIPHCLIKVKGWIASACADQISLACDIGYLNFVYEQVLIGLVLQEITHAALRCVFLLPRVALLPETDFFQPLSVDVLQLGDAPG